MDFATRTVRSPALGMDFEVLAQDSHIGPSIEKGAWEEAETRLFRAHLEPGCRVLDLGANVGWFSCLSILAGADVEAFEPVPGIADVAERNIARAMEIGSGKGTLHRHAAGSKPGNAQIALATENRGDNRVLDGGAAPPDDLGAVETIEISVMPVDRLVEGPFRIVKIDTQGSEWHALQGMRKALGSCPRVALFLEFWPYALRGCEPIELLESLVERGFTLGKATDAPYPMTPQRIVAQASQRDPVKGGLDLYCTRGVPFHAGGLKQRLHGTWRKLREGA